MDYKGYNNNIDLRSYYDNGNIKIGDYKQRQMAAERAERDKIKYNYRSDSLEHLCNFICYCSSVTINNAADTLKKINSEFNKFNDDATDKFKKINCEIDKLNDDALTNLKNINHKYKIIIFIALLSIIGLVIFNKYYINEYGVCYDMNIKPYKCSYNEYMHFKLKKIFSCYQYKCDIVECVNDIHCKSNLPTYTKFQYEGICYNSNFESYKCNFDKFLDYKTKEIYYCYNEKENTYCNIDQCINNLMCRAQISNDKYIELLKYIY